MAFELPSLPYAKDALAPHMSSETLDYHYGKHHQAYVNKLNNLTEGTELADKSLVEVIRGASGGLFNNAAQVWNHTFFWNCLSPTGGNEPGGELAEAIEKSFGGFSEFKEKFTNEATGRFGSGWAWLVQRPDSKLEVLSTPNADTPITGSDKPLMTCDVWEHAYYIDYRNARPKYLEGFWNLVNWDFVSSNLG